MRRAALGLGFLFLTGCSLDFGGSDGATRQGRDIFGLWQGSVLVALVVGGLVWGLIVFAILRYRRRDDEMPNQRQYLIKLEVFYTVVPIVIVAILFGFAYRTQNDVDALSPDPDLVIEVRGFQWQWQFRYRDENVTVTGSPGTSPQMVLPVHRTARLILTSRDVIHSFYVPDFNFKRDVIPGVTNRIDLDPTELGTYVGRCAEFCGLDHARMDFTVKVVSQDDYRDWVAGRRGDGQ
jgi:cytochrome c oxidase subunit 2